MLQACTAMHVLPGLAGPTWSLQAVAQISQRALVQEMAQAEAHR